MNPPTADARSYYEKRLVHFESLLATSRQLDRRLSRVRLLLFLVAVALFFSASLFEPYHWLAYVLVGVAVIAFLIVARRQEEVGEKRDRAARLRRWYRHALARLDRDWNRLPDRPFDIPESAQQVATDLDLFGHGSLFQLIDQTTSPRGREILGSWLIDPCEPEIVAQRQSALAELAPDRSLREELYVRGLTVAESLADPAAFVDWSQSPAWYERHPRLSAMVPILSTTFLVLTVFAAILTNLPLAFAAGAVLLVNSVICLGYGGSLYETFNRVSSRHQEIGQYRSLFRLLKETTERCDGLGHLKDRLSGGNAHVLDALKQLDGVMVLASLRHAGLIAIVHAMLQPTLLWDFHVCRRLDKWKRKFGSNVPDWFDGLGEFEALASLAVLRHDHPDWCDATLDREADCLEGGQVGHPLIGEGDRVVNDVAVGPPGTVLLVAGSNMSGKSTLLRSIGVNAVLAQAGAPVCARTFRLPPIILATSMRIRDSLEAGVSFYLAALKRLKEVVDLAADPDRRKGRILLYLLDEILQGTNSKERHIAVAHVVAHLVSQGAIGAITTHDLELATSDLLTAAIRPVHFRERFEEIDGQRKMVFDYHLREGVATTTNALTLLRMVGLGADKD